MESTKRQKKVYVIEDDIALSSIMDRVLKSIDSHVVLDWATSAEDATRALLRAKMNNMQQPYDLIIIDILLDGPQNGVDLWHLCKRVYPLMPVVLTSASRLGTFFSHDIELPETPIFMQKPFSMVECKKIFSHLLHQ